MRIYFLCAICALVFCAYSLGAAVQMAKCERNASVSMENAHRELIKQQVKIDAETNSNGIDDIRRVLREKYTIAD